MRKLPSAFEVLSGIQEQPPAHERETTEEVLLSLQDPVERLAFVLWTSNPTLDLGAFQKHLRTVLGPSAPDLITLTDWFIQHDWHALFERWKNASGYPQDASPKSMDGSLEAAESLIERIGKSTQTLVAIVEAMTSGGGTVRTGSGVLNVPPLEITGRLSELKSITDIMRTLGEKTSNLIQEWREERSEMEREGQRVMDEMGSPELIICYMRDVLKFEPPVSLMRQLGVDEEFINTLEELDQETM